MQLQYINKSVLNSHEVEWNSRDENPDTIHVYSGDLHCKTPCVWFYDCRDGQVRYSATANSAHMSNDCEHYVLRVAST